MKTELKFCPMTFNHQSGGSTCIGDKCQWWITTNKTTGQREKVTNDFIYEYIGNCCFVMLTCNILNKGDNK